MRTAVKIARVKALLRSSVHNPKVTARGMRMTASQSGTLVENAPALSADQDVPLSLPEATMLIIGSSGVLWALLYGTFNAFFG